MTPRGPQVTPNSLVLHPLEPTFWNTPILPSKFQGSQIFTYQWRQRGQLMGQLFLHPKVSQFGYKSLMGGSDPFPTPPVRQPDCLLKAAL